MEPAPTTTDVHPAPMTPAEHFKIELDALMVKYPTVRLSVTHQVSIDEIKPTA